MLGSMLAGTQESAGRVVKRGTKLYKTYRFEYVFLKNICKFD